MLLFKLHKPQCQHVDLLRFPPLWTVTYLCLKGLPLPKSWLDSWQVMTVKIMFWARPIKNYIKTNRITPQPKHPNIPAPCRRYFTNNIWSFCLLYGYVSLPETSDFSSKQWRSRGGGWRGRVGHVPQSQKFLKFFYKKVQFSGHTGQNQGFPPPNKTSGYACVFG